MKTWSDVKSFISKHELPFNVLRFHMSIGGLLINIDTGETVADTVESAANYLNLWLEVSSPAYSKASQIVARSEKATRRNVA